MNDGITDDDICRAVYDAAEQYVLLHVKNKDVLEFDLGVRLEDGELQVELFLVTTTGDDEVITQDALKAAMGEGDRLFEGG